MHQSIANSPRKTATFANLRGNVPAKILYLIDLAAQGSSSASCALAEYHGITLEPLDDGDFELVQRAYISISG